MLTFAAPNVKLVQSLTGKGRRIILTTNLASFNQ